MWDYDKLFTKGNVIGLKETKENKLYTHVVYEKEDWMDYFNDSFSYKPKNVASEIQYIIRLDEHGNVVEKLFDREKDMPKPMPELETGMFIRLADKTDWRDNTVAYVDYQNNRIIAKEGWYEKLSDRDEWQYLEIVEVFSKSVCCFNQCVDNRVIWRSPQYQTYLNSKEPQ